MEINRYIISINGDLIDLKSVFEIGQIKKGHMSVSFEIRYFGNETYIVHYPCFQGTDDYTVNEEYYEFIKKHGVNSTDALTKRSEKIAENLSKLREEIVAIWSNNQSEIKQFSTTDYKYEY